MSKVSEKRAKINMLIEKHIIGGDYILPPPMKLCDWVDIEKLDWDLLSQNYNAINLLEQNINRINWMQFTTNKNPYAFYLLEKFAKIEDIPLHYLSMNQYALPILFKILRSEYDMYKSHISPLFLSLNNNTKIIEYLEQKKENIDWVKENIDWVSLSLNENAIDFLKRNPKRIIWNALSGNKNAIDMLVENPTKIDWFAICRNQNPKAMEMIDNFIQINPRKNLKLLNKDGLSENPAAIPLLKKYPQLINWNWLCVNPNGIEIIEENMGHINWSLLSGNPNAIHILKNNMEFVDWVFLSKNPGIFTYDYDAMLQTNILLKKEIILNALRPERIACWLESGMSIDDI